MHTPKRLTLFAGHYGSGKTNIALNYARSLHRDQGLPVTIADLDIVNPYFRTKDSEQQLSAEGIGLICSPFANSNLDVPAMPKETAEDVLSSVPYAEAVSRLTGLPVFMTCCAEALYPELAGTIDRLFPLKLQKLYYQLTQEVSYGKTNISGRAL